jgi:hypothetical protein
MNHSAITGPKSRPTFAVPTRCTAKSTTMITTVIGMTNGSSSGRTTRSPSTAESTEMAGVIMLSARNNDAPKMPSVANASAARLRASDDVVRPLLSSVINERMPPSPSLSARSTRPT